MALQGRCFCGAVEIEATGSPEAMGYCHCESCRSWSASPVNAFSLWKPESVRVTKGAERDRHLRQDADERAQVLQEVRRTPDGQPPAVGDGRRLSGTLPGLDFQPALHLNYAETVLPIGTGCRK